LVEQAGGRAKYSTNHEQAMTSKMSFANKIFSPPRGTVTAESLGATYYYMSVFIKFIMKIILSIISSLPFASSRLIGIDAVVGGPSPSYADTDKPTPLPTTSPTQCNLECDTDDGTFQ
jgi:hypothetical protein